MKKWLTPLITSFNIKLNRLPYSSPMIEQNNIQDILNKTFSGLTLFYRDTPLPSDLQNRYSPGQVLMEKAFTDMSWKGGGLEGDFRYLIASAFGKDLSAFHPKAEKFGLAVLQPDSYFKVLDIFELEGKKQVLLLNIPVEGVDVFSRTTINIEDEIVSMARENFSERIKQSPVPELCDVEWLQRISFPIGMTEEGEFFK